MYRIMQLDIVLRSEIPGEKHTASGGQPGKKTHQQLGYIGPRTNGRQRRCANAFADHYGIDTVVEVLEYLTDQYRQSKHNYQPWYIALSQIGTCFPQYNLSPSQYYLSSNSILALHIFFKFFTRCLLFSTSLT